jgi:predicted transposase YdaD
MTNNTSLQKPVAKYMRIYGVEIDITKDRYYKVGREEGIEEGREEGREEGKLYTAAELIYSGLVSLEATAEKLKLNPDEITQLEVIITQMQNKP